MSEVTSQYVQTTLVSVRSAARTGLRSTGEGAAVGRCRILASKEQGKSKEFEPKCPVGVNIVTIMCKSVLEYAPKSSRLRFWWQHGGLKRAKGHFWGRSWEVLGDGERPQDEPKTAIWGILRGPGTAPELAVHGYPTGRSFRGQNIVFHI